MLNWNAAGNNFAIELNKLGEIKLNEFYEFQIHVTFTKISVKFEAVSNELYLNSSGEF